LRFDFVMCLILFRTGFCRVHRVGKTGDKW
jgi:hypothetical protein